MVGRFTDDGGNRRFLTYGEGFAMSDRLVADGWWEEVEPLCQPRTNLD